MALVLGSFRDVAIGVFFRLWGTNRAPNCGRKSATWKLGDIALVVTERHAA